MRSEFENSIKWSSSYEKLVYQHGERLFIFDDDKYKIAAIQLAWELSKNQQAKVDELNQQLESEREETIKGYTKISDLRLERDELQLQLSEDSRILHNVIDIERKKNDELQKQKSLQEMEINHLGQANQAWQLKCDELQKRVDASNKVLESMRKEIEHGHLSEDESQTLSSYANDLEQALKGGCDE